MSATIHWLGVGLSSTPGIKYLSTTANNLVVWNRSLDKAKDMLADLQIEAELRTLDWQALTDAVSAGDVLVSMLPATMHIKVAELCLEKQAHFVSSSYISDEMAELNQKAQELSLCFVNEVGLDPGIDHLFAHMLVEDYKQSSAFSGDNQLSFRSYCGGFPKQANDFKYKFSWSPLGVLKALTSPAQWVEEGEVKQSKGPWEALKDIHIALADETFQAYPNRDSVPFQEQYQFSEDWNVKEFVRGTLRLDGWAQAWQYLFDQVGELKGEEGLAKLTEISNELQEKYSYDEGEADRVVLFVELEANNQAGDPVWHQSFFMDAAGTDQGQAMARLVSMPVAFAIESVIEGRVRPGVTAAPSDRETICHWLDKLTIHGEQILLTDHLAG